MARCGFINRQSKSSKNCRSINCFYDFRFEECDYDEYDEGLLETCVDIPSSPVNSAEGKTGAVAIVTPEISEWVATFMVSKISILYFSFSFQLGRGP